MENLNEENEYLENQTVMARRYITQAEKQVFRRLTILGVTTLLVIIVLFFWGLPLLARLAGVLTFLPGRNTSKDGSDIIPPFPPRLENLPTATNSAKIKLTGFSEAESTVEIFLNGELAQKLKTDIAGKFEIENFNLTYGPNKIQLKAQDKAGNSSPTSEHQIVFDNTPPTLEVSEPEPGTVFVGQSNLIKVAGKTDQETTVLVNGFWAIVDTEGKFTLSYPATVGENKLEITAQDIAGNQTKKTLTVFYQP